MHPVRLRDFICDRDGWLYAVSAYDNSSRVGCVLRYIPDPAGERSRPDGSRYHKLDFSEAYERIARDKPAYLDLLHRVPLSDITEVYKPEERMAEIRTRDARVERLASTLGLKGGMCGCTGSLLLGLETPASDIDLVVYGEEWFLARAALMKGVNEGAVGGMTPELWRTVYNKRVPEIPYDVFVLHESRKWNRGVIDGTYFDLLYTRDYGDLPVEPSGRGEVCGKMKIEALVTGDEHAFDSPSEYRVDHDCISRVFSFTHTYCGQVFTGETMEACGVCEKHGDEQWLIIGTTREAKGEYIVSLSLLESQ